MALLSLLFVFCFTTWHAASQSNNSNTTTSPATTMGPADSHVYYIGDEYNVAWNYTSISSKTVKIVLYYGNETWTMATDLSNTGSAQVGGDLGQSAQQLMIENGTMGQFRVESDAGSNNSQSLLVSNVVICQSVIFDTPGRTIASGSDAKGVVVKMKQATYYKLMQEGAEWVASFVTVNEDEMTWSVDAGLEIFKASGTPAPSAMPTTTPTKTTTAAQADSDDPAKPTTFFSTASPTKAQKGLRLADAMSVYQVSLGMENVDGRVGLIDCNGRDLEDRWCQVNMTVKVPEETESGGPYDLIIGLNGTSLQYYGTNMDTANENAVTQFIAYDREEVDISLTRDDDPINETIYKYEKLEMAVTLGDSLNVPVYIVVMQQTFLDDFRYVLECGMVHNASYFTAFGWKTYALSGFERDKTDLPQGTYEFELYWAVSSDYESVVGDENYRLTTNLSQFTVQNDGNDSTSPVPVVSIKDDAYKFSRGSNKVDFETSFNDGSLFQGYIVQCRYSNASNAINSTICDKYGNSTFNFTSVSTGNKVSIDFPHNLYDTNMDDNSSETHFVVWTELCDDENELVTEIPLEIGKKSSSNNGGLSAGAIVGIVCAGVLVLGLAAWWLCMKKSSGDGYRELNE